MRIIKDMLILKIVREEITRATRNLAAVVKTGELDESEVSEAFLPGMGGADPL